MAVDNLASGASLDAEVDWQVMDNAHYDINTCLRETTVLLKSFLLVLPDDQLGALQKTVRAQMRVSDPSISHGDPLIRARRMASVGGQ